MMVCGSPGRGVGKVWHDYASRGFVMTGVALQRRLQNVWLVAALMSAPLLPVAAQRTPVKKAAPKVVVPPASLVKGALPDTTPPAGLSIDGVAAVVGDQAILVSEVLAEANRRRAAGAEVKSAADMARLETRVINDLVEGELLVQKAKTEKVEVNEADITRTLDDNQKKIRAQFKSDAEFKSELKSAGFGSVEEWRKMQSELIKRDNLQRDLIQKLRRDGKMTAVNVSEAEVSEAFNTNKERLPRKEARVGLRQIVVATRPSEAAKKRARAKADSIHAELELHPNDFETIAKKESMDPGSRELGGDLGWNRRGRMVPEFDRIMFALNPGVISPVFETVFGFHIIRVDRVQPAEVKSRHILIRPTLDSADESRAKLLAADVAKQWRGGASYDSLTAKYHDEAGAEEKTIPEYVRDSLPESYRNAIEGKKLNEILDPFPIADAQAGANKFVISQITFLDQAGVYTLPEMRGKIRAQLSEERGMRRLIDSLKKQNYVSIRYDPAKQPIGPAQP